MAHVLKINYENSLRRVIVKPQPETGVVDLSYQQLEAKIRSLFNIPPSLALLLTYKDKDEDVVTLAQDEDLEDAILIQSLNPLKIEVSCLQDKSTGKGKNPAGLNGQSGSSPAIDIPNLAEILEKNLLPQIDSLKGIASGHLSSLSKKLELDGNLPAKTLSDILQALSKEISKDKKVSFDDRDKDVGSGPSRKESGDCSDPFSDPTAEVKQPSQFPSCRGQVRRHHQADGVLHHGVECDVCGMVPIVGPRFQSLKKDDYDLCSGCFKDTKATEEEYVKYDQPMRYHGGRHFFGFNGGKMPRCPYFEPSIFGRPSFGSRSGFPGNHHYGRQEHRAHHHNPFGKLDGRFVKDVTIFDGTELAPGTSFTKIWKLRNSGLFPWPQNTQLVRVGGDELGSATFASLELNEGGLLPDEEIDVSVDLVAPENPGRYISHWRLITPSGVKFGHRVWVSILVVSKDEQSPQVLESLKNDSENHQHHMDDEMAEGEDDAGLDTEKPMEVVGTVEASLLKSLSEVNVQEPSAPVVDMLETEEQQKVEAAILENSELGAFSLVDAPQIANVEVQGVVKSNKALSDVSYSDVELLPDSWKVEPSQHAPAISKEETLLNQLETIGFTDRTLNLELLKKNNNDLQLVLDDLFAAEKWDSMLNKLQEMGFTDADLNLRLLFKNDGSLKRVVKELVQIYKVSDSKSKA